MTTTPTRTPALEIRETADGRYHIYVYGQQFAPLPAATYEEASEVVAWLRRERGIGADRCQ